MKIMIPTRWLGLLLIPVFGAAQSEKINWNSFELTGGRFKTNLIGIVARKPDWPYYVGGGVAAGVGVYFITRDQQESLPVLTVSDDALSVFCGSSASVNVLANDIGEGLQVTEVTQPGGATVMTTTGGNILITNIGIASFSFVYTVTDRVGQTATGRVEVAVSLLPIAAVNDAFTRISTMPLSGNVLMNDVGTQISVTSNTIPAGGVLALAANGQFTFNADPGFCGTTAFSYTIADACGQSATATVNLTIEDRELPMVTCPPVIALSCDVSTDPANTGTATATDNCTPTGQIAISFTDQTSTGQIIRTWTATDLAGNAASCNQTITISDGIAPVVTCPLAITVPCGSSTQPSATGTATATDNCTPTGQLTISFTDQSSTGQIIRTWTATDLVGNAASCNQIITINDGIAPVVTCPAAITVPCGNSTQPSATGTATATDNCTPTGQIAISFTDQPSTGQIIRTWTAIDLAGNAASCNQTITISDGVAPVVTCPPAITVPCGNSTQPSATGTATATDNCTPTGQLTITFTDQSSTGQIIRTWTATDLVGNAASCNQTITISDGIAPVVTCPAAITVPCGNSTQPSATGTATATDNCTPTGQIAISFTDQPSTGQIIRTWTATDLVGNAASCNQTITISDGIAPVVTCPAAITVPCGSSTQPSATGTATATDNCTPTSQIAISFTDQTSTGQIIRTWTATDLAGNSASCNQTITISDGIAPVVTCPPAITVPCGSSTLPSATGTATATDNCTPTGQIAITFTDQSSTGQIIRTWTATDLAGNAASCNQTITISDGIAPVVTCPAAITVPCGSSTQPSATGTATATDNCTPTGQLTITFTDQSSTGQIIRTWTATDLVGNAASCNQTITISDGIAPVVTCPAAITVPCGSSTLPSATGTATATDNCTPTGQIAISFTDQTSTGQIIRTWTATDLAGNAASCNQTITISDGIAPVVTCPATITVPCGSSTQPSATGTATATDNCTPVGQLTITFTDQSSTGQIIRTWTATDLAGNAASCNQTITISDGIAPVVTCPPAITVPCGSSTQPSATGTATATDNCTPAGQLTITFTDQSSTGQIIRTWTATDLAGNAASCNQTITISDGIAPVVTCPQPITVPCGSSTQPSATGTATATDNCTPTGQLTITFTDQSSTDQIIRTWTATDLAGNAASCNQTITISDGIAPVVTCPAAITVPCGSSTQPSATGTATATDNCTPTGQLTITFTDQSSTGQIIRTWTATDLAGNAASCNQTITISDGIAPVVTCPAAITVPCGSSTQPSATGTATATDNCTPTSQIAISFTDQTSTGQIIRTWTATDLAGNAASCNQTITISDGIAPVVTCPPAITVSCGSSTQPSATGTATATDNCTPVGQLTISFTDQTPGPGCDRTIMRQWMAIDLSGNTGTCTQLITISDMDAPVISCPPDITVPYGAESDLTVTGQPVVSDPCGNPITTTFEDNLSDFSNCTGLIVRNWVATDDCGNSSVCQQVIIVEAPYSLEALDITPPSTPSGNDGMVVLRVTPNSVVLPMAVFVNGVFHSTANATVFTVFGLSAGNYTFRIIEAFGNGCASNEISVFIPFLSPKLTRPERKQEWDQAVKATVLFNQGSIGNPFGEWELRFSVNGKKAKPYLGLTGQLWSGNMNHAGVFPNRRNPAGFDNNIWEVNLRAGLQFQLGNNTFLELNFPTVSRLSRIGQTNPLLRGSTNFSVVLRQRFR